MRHGIFLSDNALRQPTFPHGVWKSMWKMWIIGYVDKYRNSLCQLEAKIVCNSEIRVSPSSVTLRVPPSPVRGKARTLTVIQIWSSIGRRTDKPFPNEKIFVVYQKSTKKETQPLAAQGAAFFCVFGGLPDVYQDYFLS